MFEWVQSFFKTEKPRGPGRFFEHSLVINIDLPTPEEMRILVYGDICLKLYEETLKLNRHEGKDERKEIVNLCDSVSGDLSCLRGQRSHEMTEQALTHLSITEHVKASNQQQLVEISIIEFIKSHMQDYVNKLLSSKDARALGGEFLVESIKLVFENLPALGANTVGRDKMDLFLELLSETWLALDERQKRNLEGLFRDPNVQALFQDLEYYIGQGLREKSQRNRLIQLGKQQLTFGGALHLCKQVAAISNTIRSTLDRVIIRPREAGEAIRPSRFYKDNEYIINRAMDVLSQRIYQLADFNNQKRTDAAPNTIARRR